jgi:hypothetical protein
MITDTRAGPFVLIVAYRAEAIAANMPKHFPFLFVWGHSLPSRWAFGHYQFCLH